MRETDRVSKVNGYIGSTSFFVELSRFLHELRERGQLEGVYSDINQKLKRGTGKERSVRNIDDPSGLASSLSRRRLVDIRSFDFDPITIPSEKLGHLVCRDIISAAGKFWF